MTGGTEGAKDGDNNPRKVLEALLKEMSSSVANIGHLWLEADDEA